MAFFVWKLKLMGKKVIIRSDNQALVDILNKKSSKNKRVMALIRQLVLMLLQNDMPIRSFHIDGVNNEISDAISRFQWDRLNRLLPEHASRTPVLVPLAFLRLFN